MTRCIAVDPQCPSEAALDDAAAVLRAGGIVAYLTDTVYGLAVDARQRRAVAGLFALKGRSPDKAVPLIIGGPQQLADVAVDLPRHAQPLMSAFWPGPLTLLLRPQPDLPASLLGASDRIGVRWPDSALSQGLALRLGGAITASSANRSGAPAALNAGEAAAQLAPAPRPHPRCRRGPRSAGFHRPRRHHRTAAADPRRQGPAGGDRVGSGLRNLVRPYGIT